MSISSLTSQITSTTWLTFAMWVVLLVVSLAGGRKLRRTGPLIGGVASLVGIYLGLSVFDESAVLGAIFVVMNLAYLFVVVSGDGK